MNKIILAVASLVMSVPAFAADNVDMAASSSSNLSGYGEFYLGGVTFAANGNSESYFTYGGAARANFNFAERWNVQGDFTADVLRPDSEDFGVYSGAAHVFWRDPSSFAVGGFASVERYSGGPDDLYRWAFGPEAQAYFDKVTLYGQAFYSEVHSDSGPGHLDMWGGQAQARYFVTENVRFIGQLGFVDWQDTDFSAFVAATQADYRFTDTPFSVFGRYQYERQGTGSDHFDTHKFVVGLRASFGSKSLLDEDRNGATMDTLRSNYLFLGGI